MAYVEKVSEKIIILKNGSDKHYGVRQINAIHGVIDQWNYFSELKHAQEFAKNLLTGGSHETRSKHKGARSI